jgi:chromosome segregation ATPase
VLKEVNFVCRYQDEITSWQSRCGVAEDEASAAATQLEQRSKDHQAAMEGWNTEMEVLRNHITGLEDSNNDLFEQIENLGLEKESIQSELWSVQEEMAALKETQVQTEEVCAWFNIKVHPIFMWSVLVHAVAS